MNTHDVTADTFLINSKGLHCQLHAVKACRFPHEVSGVAVRDFYRNPFRTPQFQTYLI